MIQRLRSVFQRLRNRLVYDWILRSYGIRKLRQLNQVSDRSHSHTYTCFYRSPGQLEALVGPVLSRINTQDLVINIYACSKGAEAYTVASVISSRHPGLSFQILASDLHQETVDYAKAATYTQEEVHAWTVKSDFIEATFDRVGALYRVKPSIASKVQFSKISLLDPAGLAKHHRPSQLNLIQNVFCHMSPEMVRQAFANILPFVQPGSALLMDGTPLDLREELTANAGLQPLDYRVREIHEFARMHIGAKWWTYYYGLEPYWPLGRNRTRRYSTIFFKEKR
ncbi:MAG: hypothetical protein JNL01_15920 [Bdellovibrionales bacterium]|nr:hypothetical protein [Bdellovibrionales bacterium]